MRIEDRLRPATTISLVIPLSYMGISWWTGRQPLSLPIASWFLFDALVQYSLILFLRNGQLSRSRFSLLSYISALVIGLPATVLSVYSGLAAEFRLVPLIYILLHTRHRGRAVYAILLFAAGILLLYPMFSGQTDYLISELFRPVSLTLILFLSIPLRKAARKQLRERIRRRRSKGSLDSDT